MGGNGDRGHQGLMKAINRDGRLWHQHARHRHPAVRQAPAALGWIPNVGTAKSRTPRGAHTEAGISPAPQGAGLVHPYAPNAGIGAGTKPVSSPSTSPQARATTKAKARELLPPSRSTRTRRPTPTSSLVRTRSRESGHMSVCMCGCVIVARGRSHPTERGEAGSLLNNPYLQEHSVD